jgi:hypothetical protein
MFCFFYYIRSNIYARSNARALIVQLKKEKCYRRHRVGPPGSAAPRPRSVIFPSSIFTLHRSLLFLFSRTVRTHDSLCCRPARGAANPPPAPPSALRSNPRSHIAASTRSLDIPEARRHSSSIVVSLRDRR